jgi:Cytochrome c554 and c-prime
LRRILLIVVTVFAMVLTTELSRRKERHADKQSDRMAHTSQLSLVKNELTPDKNDDNKATLVGRAACAECHQQNYDFHAKSGHASTFSIAADSRVVEKFNRVAVDVGEPYGLFRYFADDQGLYTQRKSDPLNRSFELQFAIGSGHNGVTLFSLVPDAAEGTIGIEHCVSWFSHDDALGLTPGQAGKIPIADNEFYGVAMRGKQMRDCIGCHTTAGTIVGQEVVGLVENVNCEKCHGPASEHVRQARLSPSPPPFSVGKDTWDAESEIQLCGSCHRMPIDVSIKDLREYKNSIVRFQPIGLLRSECYLESEGQLSCTTCHNPHQTVSAKPKADFVDDCVKCHMENSAEHVSCPVSPTEGCIDCHMRKVEFEHGTTFHDHWIRKPLASSPSSKK